MARRDSLTTLRVDLKLGDRPFPTQDPERLLAVVLEEEFGRRSHPELAALEPRDRDLARLRRNAELSPAHLDREELRELFVERAERPVVAAVANHSVRQNELGVADRRPDDVLFGRKATVGLATVAARQACAGAVTVGRREDADLTECALMESGTGCAESV